VTREEDTLSNILAWATREPDVRCLLLVGSRARTANPDDLADFDVQVYTKTHEPYTRDHQWLSGIGQVWVCVPDQYSDGDIQVPTRLVIFDGGVKVDFAFYPAGHVSSGLSAGLPHRILLDKDHASSCRETRPGPPTQPEIPSSESFSRLVEEFWFEAYHVAKYLARNELWLAKSRDWSTKQLLLAMIGWHERIVRGRAPGADFAGERVRVSPDTWELLQQTFGSFARDDAWKAALATMELFRRLATEVAAAAGFTYAADLDRNISEFIRKLRASHLDAVR